MLVKPLTWAMLSTCGPITTPSTSSSTTRGMNRLRAPAIATMVAASAEMTTMARNDPVSTRKTFTVPTANVRSAPVLKVNPL